MAPNQQPVTRSLRSAVTSAISRNRDEVLVGIEGQSVEIVSADIELHQGRFTEYDLTTIVLSDGQTFRVAGRAVSEPLSKVNFEDGPISATFRRVVSDYDPDKTYWIVE